MEIKNPIFKLEKQEKFVLEQTTGTEALQTDALARAYNHVFLLE